MKILFDVDHSFAWAHGGVQNLVENFMLHLPNIGVEVEPLKWWDKDQKGEILHTFYGSSANARLAKAKGIKVVCSIFLDHLSSRNKMNLFLRKGYINAMKKLLRNKSDYLGWNYGEIADAYIYCSKHEAFLGKYLYNANVDKSFDILYGVEEKYLNNDVSVRGDYLISINTIHPRKNILQLARIAKKARIPIKFIGKPYSQDSYFSAFMSIVDNKFVIYEGFISDELKLKYLRESRGMVTLSKVESGCIAVLEAFASGCPVFLPDLAWAKSIYDGYASFGNIFNEKKLLLQLLDFYNNPNQSYNSFPVKNWEKTALDYYSVYQTILNS